MSVAGGGALRDSGPWDVIVIGAGLAGASVSYALARAGRAVLLVESKPFPRPKVCGGCMNARAIGVLDRLGLGDLLDTAGARPYDQMRLMAHGRGVSLPLPPGVAVTRETLDTLLVERAVAAGVTFASQTTAHLTSEKHDDFREVRLASRGAAAEATARGSLVLACDGLGRPSLGGAAGLEPSVAPGSRVGLGAVLPPGTLRGLSPEEGLQMVVGREGYVGFSACEQGRTSAAAAVDRDALARLGPAQLVRELLSQAGLAAEPGLADAAWRGTKPLSQRCGRVADHRLLLLGDAAGYVEPFTGEGMAAALEGAELAGRLAAEPWCERMAETWQRAYTRAVRDRQRACSQLAWLLRRPRLTHLAIRLVECWPSLGVKTAQRISSERDRSKEFAAWAE